jgi:hypothetical protein
VIDPICRVELNIRPLDVVVQLDKVKMLVIGIENKHLSVGSKFHKRIGSVSEKQTSGVVIIMTFAVPDCCFEIFGIPSDQRIHRRLAHGPRELCGFTI